MPTLAKPPKPKKTKAQEFYFLGEDGGREDAELHEPILAAGDDAAARAISQKVAERLGLSPARAARLVRQKGWNEGEHPRVPAGGPGGGQFTGDNSGAENAGVKARNDIETRQVKDQWFASSPLKGADIATALKAATAGQKQLGKVGAEIAKTVGVEFKNPGVKQNADRIAQKATERGGVHRVTDLSRATFVIDSPDQVETIAAELGKHFEVAIEDWKVTPVNYADRVLQVRYGNGAIGEVQLMDRAMADAKSSGKGRGHDFYVEQRQLDPVKDKAKWDALHAKQAALYSKVLDGYSAAWKAALGIAIN